MVSVCLPLDALSQHLPSYLGFSYLGHGISLHSCSRKVQLLLLTLDEVAPPDLEHGAAPWVGVSSSPLLLCGRSLALSVGTPDLVREVAPVIRLSHRMGVRQGCILSPRLIYIQSTS